MNAPLSAAARRYSAAFTIDPEVLDALRERARSTGHPQSRIVEAALRRGLGLVQKDVAIVLPVDCALQTKGPRR